jgi:methyl-accepting chemotaxis protein
MAAQLRTALGGLHEVTRALNQAVAELSTSSIDQNENLSRQDAALRQAQVTAEEIRQTSKVAAEKASLVLKMTERADEVGRSGEAAVEQSAGGMTEIRAVAGGIADKITELGERTRQLGVITDGVKDLADQSNMLALNAAIEAVRSGEHGKGFGVVAREIRSLADQSIQSTNRAREILQDVTNSVRLAVSITKSGTVKMEGGLQQIRASGDYMRELSGIIKENSGIVRQIAATVGQQHTGVSQIFTAVTDLSDMMAQTMKRLESTNVAVETVKAVSSRISGIVKDYQV